MSESEYGPGGYLPDRAARRARKIVLREPLGKGWIVASIVAAVALAGLGIAYLLTQAGPPGDPYREAGPIDAVDASGAGTMPLDGQEVLVVRGAGGVQVFEAPGAEVIWCRQSRRIEADDGRVWAHDGQLRGGDGESLRPLRAEVHDGVLYVDPSAAQDQPAARPSDEQPVCR